MSLSWDQITAYALKLPGSAAATYYGKPAVKANGRAVITDSGEPGSFVLHIDRDTKAMLIETDSETFWETPHYAGWPVLLVRYATSDPERVLEMVSRAAEQAAGRPRPKPRRA